MADDFKRAPHDRLIEEAIAAKGPGYSGASARTSRTDAPAIPESLAAEADEAALTRQGVRSSDSYLTTLRALAAVARSRRTGRRADSHASARTPNQAPHPTAQSGPPVR